MTDRDEELIIWYMRGYQDKSFGYNWDLEAKKAHRLGLQDFTAGRPPREQEMLEIIKQPDTKI